MIGDHPGYEKEGDDGDNSQGDDNGEPFQSLHEIDPSGVQLILPGEQKKAAKAHAPVIAKPRPAYIRSDLIIRVSFLISVRDYLRRTWPRVQIAKTAITGDHVRAAFFYRAILAVPVHVTCPNVYYCTPRSITKSSTGRGSEPRRRQKGGDANHQFRKGFRHDDPPLFSSCLGK